VDAATIAGYDFAVDMFSLALGLACFLTLLCLVAPALKSIASDGCRQVSRVKHRVIALVLHINFFCNTHVVEVLASLALSDMASLDHLRLSFVSLCICCVEIIFCNIPLFAAPCR
jgi:hypothetical protein